MIIVSLAYTSPVIVATAIDTTKYKVVFCENNTLSDYEFIGTQPIVLLVPSVFKYLRMKNLIDNSNVQAVILFDDLVTLRNVKDLPILDWNEQGMKFVSIKELNELIETSPAIVPVFDRDLLKKVNKDLSEPATFKDMVENLLTNISESGKKDVEKALCEALIGTLSKSGWTKRVAKPIKEATTNMDAFIEIDRFIDKSKEGDALWRAFYDMAEHSLTEEKALAKHKLCNKEDLQFVCSVIKPDTGLKYTMCPKDFPTSG